MTRRMIRPAVVAAAALALFTGTQTPALAVGGTLTINGTVHVNPDVNCFPHLSPPLTIAHDLRWFPQPLNVWVFSGTNCEQDTYVGYNYSGAEETFPTGRSVRIVYG